MALLMVRLSLATALAVLAAVPNTALAVVIGRGIANTGDRPAGTPTPQVRPRLQPKSDKKFFKHDYPYDHSPVEGHAFEYPYPIIQDSDDYAKDYVKDENGDDGEWKAQEQYDKIRTKFNERKAAIDALGHKADDAKKKYKDAEDKEGDAEKTAKDAHKKVDEAHERWLKAKREAEEADKKLGEAGGEGEGNATESDKVKDATKKVEKEMSDLEKCKKELEEAQAKLRKLINGTSEDIDQAKNRSDAANHNASDEAAAEAAAKAAEDAAAEKADAAKKHADDENEVWRVAEEAYEEEEKELEEEDITLEEAEKRLRKYRNKQVGKNDAVYNSGATAAIAGPAGLRTMALAVVVVAASIEWVR